MARFIRCLVLAMPLVLLAGCGSGKKAIILNGKIVLPPGMKLGATDSIEVNFLPESGTEKGANALSKGNELSFQTKKITPGAYKVTVAVTPYPGSPEAKALAPIVEPFNRQYNSSTSKLRVDVGDAAEQTITIDLANGTVTK